MPKQNSETDKLLNNPTLSESDSELEYQSSPTGTWSGSISLSLDKKTLLLSQSQRDISDLIQKAKENIKKNRNKAQVNQALNVLDNIDKLLTGYGDSDFPEFGISTAKDKSIAIMWRFPTALLGFVIQPDTTESSWFWFMGDIDKGLKADGNLNDLDYEIQWE